MILKLTPYWLTIIILIDFHSFRMWTCVEERETYPHGRMLRKVLFSDLFENEAYAYQKIAIPKEIELKVNF
jgi:hypothetical protein